MSTHHKDYYKLLEVSTSATDAEIKAAYRKLARQYHPDLHPGEEEVYTGRFQELTEAYEVLSDPYRREQYDFRYYQAAEQPGGGYSYSYSMRPRQAYARPAYTVYEFVDDTPPVTGKYEHKYTARSRSSKPFFIVGALLVLFFQVARMLSDVAPLEQKNGTPAAVVAPGDIRNTLYRLQQETPPAQAASAAEAPPYPDSSH